MAIQVFVILSALVLGVLFVRFGEFISVSPKQGGILSLDFNRYSYHVFFLLPFGALIVGTMVLHVSIGSWYLAEIIIGLVLGILIDHMRLNKKLKASKNAY
ncbi:MAG: hypothetical protein WC536_01845 [Patescibacteria group bacterium]